MRKICGILIFSQMVLLLNGGVFDNIHSGCSVKLPTRDYIVTFIGKLRVRLLI